MAAKPSGSVAPIDISVIGAQQYAAGGKKGAKITPSAVWSTER